jgi:hypothetical protein
VQLFAHLFAWLTPKAAVPVLAANAVLSYVQISYEPQSILTVAALVQGIISLGLLGGALAVAYGYGGLNKDVQLVRKSHDALTEELRNHASRTERESEERSTRIWERLDEFGRQIAEQKGQEDAMKKLVDLLADAQKKSE